MGIAREHILTAGAVEIVIRRRALGDWVAILRHTSWLYARPLGPYPNRIEAIDDLTVLVRNLTTRTWQKGGARDWMNMGDELFRLKHRIPQG